MSAEGLVRICPLPLFAWEALEDSPSLLTVRDLLAVVPAGRLLDALRRSRGHGRDDYPVQTLWGVVLLTVLLRHPTFDACLGDLRRNAALRRLIGIQRDADLPKKWNLSRFLKVLGTEPHLTLLREVFDAMIRPLGEVVKDLGRHTAGDSSGLLARDEALPAWVAEAQANLPEDRIKTLAYDKAADDKKVHLALQKAGIEPVIQNRSMWKEALERMLPGHDGRSNIVYDEAGTVYCYDQTSEPPVRRRMAFIGHEPSRGTLKYRCPAMHEGWRCPSHDRCNAGKKLWKDRPRETGDRPQAVPADPAGHPAVRAALPWTDGC